MGSPVRVGMVGTSWWTDLFYLPALQHYPLAQLAAICGRNGERAAELAQKYGVEAVFTDYHAMLASGDLDAVIVATPDDTHYPIVMAALDAGLHVLCEKPIAANATQAKEMYQRAERAGVKHMVMFTYRWYPQFRYMHEVVAQGYLGQPYQADLSLIMDYARDGTYRWRFDADRANGVLGDLGSHLIDLARWYFGEISGVSAHLATFVARPGVDGAAPQPANDSAVLALAFANGAQATVRVSAVARSGWQDWAQQVALYGSQGSLLADADKPMLAGFSFVDEQRAALVTPPELWDGVTSGDPWEVLYRDVGGPRMFVRAIAEDLPVSPTLYDGWKTQQVIDAALESFRIGRWVDNG